MPHRSLLPFSILIGFGGAALAAPAAITPPAGSTEIAQYAAKGAQIYTCVSKGDALAWSSAEPDAELDGADGKPAGHHYKGPTWEVQDGSKVVGSVISKVPSPKADAVPWVLLSAKATGSSGTLSSAKYIVRQDTTGGLEPAAGACKAAGTVERVPYTATYVFFQ